MFEVMYFVFSFVFVSASCSPPRRRRRRVLHRRVGVWDISPPEMCKFFFSVLALCWTSCFLFSSFIFTIVIACMSESLFSFVLTHCCFSFFSSVTDIALLEQDTMGHGSGHGHLYKLFTWWRGGVWLGGWMDGDGKTGFALACTNMRVIPMGFIVECGVSWSSSGFFVSVFFFSSQHPEPPHHGARRHC